MTTPPDVLELGNHLAAAVATSQLQRASFGVWVWTADPPIERRLVLGGRRLDDGKRVEWRDPAELLLPLTWSCWSEHAPLIVIDGLARPEHARRGLDVIALAEQREIVWMLAPTAPLAHDEALVWGHELAMHALARLYRAEYGAYHLLDLELAPTRLTRANQPVGVGM